MARRRRSVENAGYTIFAPPRMTEEPPSHPAIIAETRVDIPEASVSDAVMMLDLRNTNALMFKKSATAAHSTWSIDEMTAPSAGSNRGRSDKSAVASANGAGDVVHAGRLSVECHRRCSCPDFLDFDSIRVGLSGGNKRKLLQQLAQMAGARLGLDPAAIVDTIAERERLGSTGFGSGVAIPHGKVEGLKRIYAWSCGWPSRSTTRRSTASRSTSSSCCCRRPTPAPSI